MSTHPEYYTHMENLRIVALAFSNEKKAHSEIGSILDLYGFSNISIEQIRSDVKIQAQVITEIEAVIETSKTSWEDGWIGAKESIFKSIVDDDVSLYTYILLAQHPRIVRALEVAARFYLQTGDVSSFLENYRKRHYTRRYQSYGFNVYTIMNGAVKAGHLDVVQLYLTAYKSNNGCFKLLAQTAATQGHLDVMEILIPHLQINMFGPVIDRAIENGHLDMFRLLLPYTKNFNFDLPLSLAAGNGHKDMVEILLPLTDNVDRAFTAAITHGHDDIVKMLIPRSTRLSDALYLAAKYGRKTIVELLMPRVNDHSRALVVALIWGYLEIFYLLLPQAENIDEALIRALDKDLPDIVELLFPRARDTATIFVTACRTGCHWIIDRLLPIYRDVPGAIDPALNEAAMAGHPDIAQLLIPYATDYRRALEFAASWKRIEVVKLLIPRVGNFAGILRPAIKGGDPDIVRLLIPYETEKIDDYYFEMARIRNWRMGEILAPHVIDVDRAIAQAIHAGETGIVRILLPHAVRKDILLKLAIETKHPTIADMIRK